MHSSGFGESGSRLTAYLTEPCSQGITVTDSRGIPPHSAAPEAPAFRQPVMNL